MISDNTQGNPYHDEKGRFAAASGGAGNPPPENPEKDETGNFSGQKEWKYTPDKEWDEYCVDSIVKETNLDVMEAVKLNSSLQKYIMNVSEMSPKDIENVDNLLSKMDKFKGNIFRGLSFYEDDINEFIKNYQEGNIISTDSLSSWTSKPDVVLRSEFSDWKSPFCDSVIFKCKNNKSGVGIAHISQYNYEDEVLCPTTTRYRIKSIIGESKPNGKRRIMIELEEI